MARKQNADDRDDVTRNGEAADTAKSADQTPEPAEERLDELLDASDLLAAEAATADEETPNVPSESDLESQGFTPDEVSRLIVISDRVARSPESRDAEAMLRRLRFTRWLVERGVLDEWSA
jgi:hypothetical protein